MKRLSTQRAHKHVIIVVACLCLSLTTQLLFVGWASLVSEARGFRGVPLGVNIDDLGRENQLPVQWVFLVSQDSVADPKKNRTVPVLESHWGRWAVIRVARRFPVAFNGMQALPVQPSGIPGWATDLAAEAPTAQDADRSRTISDVAIGYPYPALAFTTQVRQNPAEIEVRSAIEVFTLSDAERQAKFNAGKGFGPLGSFPTRVIWPGMLINILIGACVWAAPFLLLVAARALRGRHRLKRGLCASCGYGPWTGGGACPECGSRLAL